MGEAGRTGQTGVIMTSRERQSNAEDAGWSRLGATSRERSSRERQDELGESRWPGRGTKGWTTGQDKLG